MPYNRPLLPALIARAQSDLQIGLEGVDPYLRRTPERVIATIQAGLAHELHGHIEWNSKQLIPDKADAENMLRWAAIFLKNAPGGPRKPAAPAVGNLNVVGSNGSDLPLGSLYQRNDGVRFKTTADVTMEGGIVSVPLQAVVVGAAGNTDAGTPLTLVNPVRGVQAQGTVDGNGIQNGADIEGLDSVLQRLLTRIQTPPQAGTPEDYVGWALSVSSVTRAWAFSNLLGLGTVSVYAVCDASTPITPVAGTIAAIVAAIDAVRPVTAQVSVFGPTLDSLNPHIQIVPATGVTLASAQAAVTAALAELLLAEGQVGGSPAGLPAPGAYQAGWNAVAPAVNTQLAIGLNVWMAAIVTGPTASTTAPAALAASANRGAKVVDGGVTWQLVSSQIPLSHVLDAIGNAAGVADYTMSQLLGGAPANIVPGTGHLPVLGNITWS